MPSTSEIQFGSVEDVAFITHSTTDPRRAGRVDLAIFPLMFLELLREKRIYFNKEFYADGVTFTRIFAEFYELDVRIEPNEDYFPRNYRHRLPPANAPKLVGGSKKGERRKVVEFFDRLKYKSKSEWCELEVQCQDGFVATIKVNKFLVHSIPKRMTLPKGKSGLYFVGGSSDKHINNRHGSSLALHILDQAGIPTKSGPILDRYDVFDYRLDVGSGTFLASNALKNHYHHQPDFTVLQITCDSDKWEPIDSDRTWRFSSENTVKGMLFVAISHESVDEIREYLWRYDDSTQEVYSFDQNKTKTYLKRLVATQAGLAIGEQTKPSKITVAYKKAVDTDDLSARAKYENLEFATMEKPGKFRRYTNPVHLAYKHVVTSGGVVAWDNGEALDYRKSAVRLAKPD